MPRGERLLLDDRNIGHDGLAYNTREVECQRAVADRDREAPGNRSIFGSGGAEHIEIGDRIHAIGSDRKDSLSSRCGARLDETQGHRVIAVGLRDLIPPCVRLVVASKI